MRMKLRELKREVANVYNVCQLLDSPSFLTSGALRASQPVSCGVVVLLSGVFEVFLKNCVSGYVCLLNDKKLPANAISEKMLLKHFRDGGGALVAEVKRVLKNKKGPTDPVVFSSIEDLVKRLGARAASGLTELAWEPFAETKGNPGPDVVRDILTGLDVQEGWSLIQQEAHLLTNGVVNLKTWLEAFIDLRNECAHTGASSNAPTTSEIREHAFRFGLTAHCIVRILEKKLKSY